MKKKPEIEIAKIILTCPDCGAELKTDICDICGCEIDLGAIYIDIQPSEILD